MSQRRQWLTVVPGVVFASALVLFATWPHPREPIYQGKTLSQWLLYRGNTDAFISMQDPDSHKAIRAMGTNAIPFLLRWIRYEPPAWSKIWVSLAPRLYIRVSEDWRLERANAAWVALGCLGAKASPAIPELSRLLETTKSPVMLDRIVYALGCMGEEALPALLPALSNQLIPAREILVAQIGSMNPTGPCEDSTVGALLECLRDSDRIVRRAAAHSLGKLGLQPERVVPALTKGLIDPAAKVRAACGESLQKFGERAREAIPALLKARKDPDFDVRMAAESALSAIAPEMVIEEQF
jgi:hypothetical protein